VSTGQIVRVLLVDDESVFLETLSRRLRARSLQVLCVEGGGEALTALAAHPTDVVVLDMMMPGLGGLEALREIKRSDPSVEVIILTGHADMESAVAGMRFGAFDFLMKPVDIDHLSSRIKDAARARRAGTEGKR
jgi:DNA-binding NtrC family response regulator